VKVQSAAGSRTGDPFNLQRFITAQASTYERARAELARGRKTSHWMWFIFPQIRGLGNSHMAVTYAISSIEEARAYLAHPVLGPRLRECVQLVNEVEGASLVEIFGRPDDLKFRSSMTLFARAATAPPEEGRRKTAPAPREPDAGFRRALEKYCDSVEDPSTVERL
jgi:uncharacterized protein (DUF1810 family)